MVVLGHLIFKAETRDILGLDAERKPLRIAVFGATSIVTSIVTDSKTVTVCQESLDGSVKENVFL